MSAGINISNYESFLLRFIDGELTAAEEASFLDFLEQHPHVQQELQVWESTVLTPDLQVTFDDKELLYRGKQELDSTNQTGFLLSYLDNELTASERDAVERYIAAQPAAQAELALLQMTRLEPDMQQVFMPKASLYRHRRRVAPAIWWSIGVAAMVAGLLVWVLPMQEKHNAGNGALVASAQHANVTPVPQAQVAVPQQHASSVIPEQQNTVNTNNTQTTANTNTTQTIAQNAGHASATVVAANRQKGQPGINTTAANTVSNTGAASTTTPPANVVNNAATNSNSKLIAAANSNGNTDNTTLSRTTTANNATSNTETVTVSTPPAVAVSSQEVPVEKAPVMLAAVSAKEQAGTPIHGELIASVVGTGDSKLLDKVTNVARFFAKKKANNK